MNRAYTCLLKTVSLDNAIREFSLAQPSWVMSHYTMLCKYCKQTRDSWGVFIFSLVYFSIFWGRFDKTIIPFALVGYEIGYSQLGPTGLLGYLPSHIQCALMEYSIRIFQVCVTYCLRLEYSRILLRHNHIFESRILQNILAFTQ